jgi:hypothetical protein
MELRSIGLQERAYEMESEYAEQWQVRSKAIRMQAEQMISPEAKSLMFGVADDYEHLTQIAEAMALIRSVLVSVIESPAFEELDARSQFRSQRPVADCRGFASPDETPKARGATPERRPSDRWGGGG